MSDNIPLDQQDKPGPSKPPSITQGSFSGMVSRVDVSVALERNWKTEKLMVTVCNGLSDPTVKEINLIDTFTGKDTRITPKLLLNPSNVLWLPPMFNQNIIFFYGNKHNKIRAFWLGETSALVEDEGFSGEDKIVGAALLPRSCLQSDDLNKVILAVEPSMRAPVLRHFKWTIARKVLF